MAAGRKGGWPARSGAPAANQVAVARINRATLPPSHSARCFKQLRETGSVSGDSNNQKSWLRPISSAADLRREVVVSDQATVRLPAIDLEVPAPPTTQHVSSVAAMQQNIPVTHVPAPLVGLTKHRPAPSAPQPVDRMSCTQQNGGDERQTFQSKADFFPRSFTALSTQVQAVGRYTTVEGLVTGLISGCEQRRSDPASGLLLGRWRARPSCRSRSISRAEHRDLQPLPRRDGFRVCARTAGACRGSREQWCRQQQ